MQRAKLMTSPTWHLLAGRQIGKSAINCQLITFQPLSANPVPRHSKLSVFQPSRGFSMPTATDYFWPRDENSSARDLTNSWVSHQRDDVNRVDTSATHSVAPSCFERYDTKIAIARDRLRA